ncbi:MAG: flagellar protein FlgN [Pseudomonadota bacterium]|nr:flagellar protein FlgN [Pseudomonadota bacterium]
MNHDVRHSLADILDREIVVAQALTETLAAERDALTGDSAHALRRKAADKVRLLGNIEALEAERRALWESPSAEGGPGSVVADRWRKLMELVAACRSANEVNGHIIHIRQNQIRQLFDIVRGGASMTYGPQGKTFARALRALAQA